MSTATVDLTADLTADLTVAIVNYRSQDLLARCLETLADATRGIRVELCIVENGTGEVLRDLLDRHAPDARLVVFDRSVAFSAAVNSVLLRARGRHVALLNPDTLLGADALTRLVRFLDANLDVGVVGPRVWDDVQRTSIQRSWRTFPTFATSVFSRYSWLSRLWPTNPWTRAYLRLDAPLDAVQDTDWVSGCCMVIRGEVFRRLSGLDPAYPLFCEDVDFCRRANQLGFKVVYDPQAEIVHHVGGSRKRACLRSEWLRHRSISHYIFKFRGKASPVSWALVAGVWGRFAVHALRTRRSV